MNPELFNVAAQWDLTRFFENAKDLVQESGGAFLMTIGAFLIVWAGWMIGQKFFGSPQAQQQNGWGKIAGALILGGALAFGGYKVISGVASAGEETVRKLGNGLIDPTGTYQSVVDVVNSIPPLF